MKQFFKVIVIVAVLTGAALVFLYLSRKPAPPAQPDASSTHVMIADARAAVATNYDVPEEHIIIESVSFPLAEILPGDDHFFLSFINLETYEETIGENSWDFSHEEFDVFVYTDGRIKQNGTSRSKSSYKFLPKSKDSGSSEIPDIDYIAAARKALTAEFPQEVTKPLIPFSCRFHFNLRTQLQPKFEKIYVLLFDPADITPPELPGQSYQAKAYGVDIYADGTARYRGRNLVGSSPKFEQIYKIMNQENDSGDSPANALKN